MMRRDRGIQLQEPQYVILGLMEQRDGEVDDDEFAA